MQLALGSRASVFQFHNPVLVQCCTVPVGVGYLRVPMLKMSFLGPYDVAEILMLIASVVVVAAILVAI
jgi:hypothetical protein